MRKLLISTLFFGLVGMIMLNACVDEKSVKYQRYYADGSQLYKTHCANFHMDDGKGLAELIPPLTDTAFLKKNRTKLSCFVVYDLNDSIIVNGTLYNGEMPAEKHLAPIDLAKTLTYITNSFGNNQGIYDVTEVDKHLRDCK